ncbi:MAG: hypothetical protein DRR19_16935 [Candidatus Parabeggiatoa sp. nov. 1]|nr:MAG: hypothetical protein DRR19_16935 [Gammaproteobacteria bacterium]
MKFLKYLLKNQWPFWLGGFFVGLAEIIYYYRYDSFIVVTTGFAQMFAVSEEYLFGIDWVGRLYQPGIHWVIIGALLGARLVVIAEGESRAWVHYHWRMLMLSFIGGMLFSFGTRIAGGCTTHHFIGGIPAMSIASWVVLLTGIPFAFLAFKISLVFGMGGYFRHQETRETACRYAEHPDHPHPGYQPDYQPWRDPLRIILNLFLLTFLLVPLYFALFTEEIFGAASDIGWQEVTWLMIAGLLMGFGIGKCGFGTECAVMAPESAFTKADFYRRNGVPMATYTMFRGMLPLQGFMVAIVMFNLFILGSWLLNVGSVPNAAGEEGLYWGHILGGPLLAMGAVFMIGCEVRTYARLGMGYATALAALPGFYIGYLPYTFYYEQIDKVVFGEGLTEFITIPEWAAYTLGGTEYIWAIGYSLLLIGLLVFSFEYGRRFLKTTLPNLVRRNTDQLVYEACDKS